MSTAATRTQFTPEDLLTLPDGDRFELIDGNLVERNMSYWSSYVAGIIFRLLSIHCVQKNLGWVSPEGSTYQCFANDPRRVRKADVSFIRLERLTPDRATAEGHMSVAPDLAVEVVSRNDLYYEVDVKAEEWLAAGVQLVWIVNPRTRIVTVRRADGTSATLRENDELTGENIVPGFRCKVGELFVLPTETTPNR